MRLIMFHQLNQRGENCVNEMIVIHLFTKMIAVWSCCVPLSCFPVSSFQVACWRLTSSVFGYTIISIEITGVLDITDKALTLSIFPGAVSPLTVLLPASTMTAWSFL